MGKTARIRSQTKSGTWRYSVSSIKAVAVPDGHDSSCGCWTGLAEPETGSAPCGTAADRSTAIPRERERDIYIYIYIYIYRERERERERKRKRAR